MKESILLLLKQGPIRPTCLNEILRIEGYEDYAIRQKVLELLVAEPPEIELTSDRYLKIITVIQK